ncbi:MAG: type 4a pilus biogenesis protein PilO [Planctomycetota bacterium]|nr:type 4a pilus biogenesis protein PilO [Planctomycetota bacterium]
MKLKNGNTRVVLICAVTTVLALGGFGYFTWVDMGHMEELDQASASLDAKIRKADGEIRNIPALEDRVLILREQVKEYVTILPDDAEIHAFVDQLTRFETESGVVVTKLDDAQARQRRSTRRKSPSAFESITYKLALRGTTQQLLAFTDLLENDYDRFVRIPTLKVQAFDDRQTRDLDPEEVDLQHDIDLALETYVYNPKKRGHDHVSIPNEPRKLERLREEGRLEVFAADVALVRYEIEAKPSRRDPFLDPRLLGGRVSEEERRAQQDELDDLKGRLKALNDALVLEGKETNLVKRMQVADKNNEFLATLAVDVKQRAEAEFFTVPELAEDFESAVLGPVRKLQGERGGVGTTAALQARDIENRVAEMEKAIGSREWGQVITLYDEIKQLNARFSVPESVRPVFVRAEEMFHLASAHRAFDALELVFGGCVIYRGDLAKAVIIISGSSLGSNPHSFSPGEVVSDGLTITKITNTEVVFAYKGYEISRRHGADR